MLFQIRLYIICLVFLIVSLPRYAFLPSMAKVPLGLTREPKFCSGTPCVHYVTDRHYGAVSHIATSNGLTPTKDFLNSLRSLKNRRLPETTGLRFALHGPQRLTFAANAPSAPTSILLFLPKSIPFWLANKIVPIATGSWLTPMTIRHKRVAFYRPD